MKLISRNAKLWITFYHQSKRYRRSLNLDDTAANRKLATTKILPEIQYKLSQGTFFNKNETPLLADFAQKSFTMHANNRKESTKYDYETSYRLHIAPTFAKKRMNAIKASDIALWQNKLLETLSPRRVRNIRAVLNTFFEDALKDEIIDKNPMSLVKQPRVEAVEENAFSLLEMQRIIKEAKGELKTFCALGFLTGMRSGEMIGLKWSDVDFSRQKISIKRAIKMGVISTPKTQSSIRTIDIIDELVPYMQKQFKRTGDKDSYVFLNKDGDHYYDIKRIRDTKWKKLLQKLGLDYRPTYQMRHTFASLMIGNGENILWVSKMLGHTSTAMTFDRYAKYNENDRVTKATFLQGKL